MVDKQVIGEWIATADDDLAFAKAALEDDLEYYM